MACLLYNLTEDGRRRTGIGELVDRQNGRLGQVNRLGSDSAGAACCTGVARVGAMRTPRHLHPGQVCGPLAQRRDSQNFSSQSA